MKVLIMLFCADHNQITAAEALKTGFLNEHIECDIKDLIHYRIQAGNSMNPSRTKHVNDVFYIDGFEQDLLNGGYTSIVFTDVYPARLFEKIKICHDLDISSFLVQLDYESHIKCLDLNVDVIFVPDKNLAELYLSHKHNSKRIIDSGIPTRKFILSKKRCFASDFLCLIFADGYDVGTVISLVEFAFEKIRFDISFAIVSHMPECYKRLAGRFDGHKNVSVFPSTEDFFDFCIVSPSVVVCNSMSIDISTSLNNRLIPIMLDCESSYINESYSYLESLGVSIPCRKIEEVPDALTVLIVNEDFGRIRIKNQNEIIPCDATKTIIEAIINYNNINLTTNERGNDNG